MCKVHICSAMAARVSHFSSPTAAGEEETDVSALRFLLPVPRVNPRRLLRIVIDEVDLAVIVPAEVPSGR